MQIGWFGKHKNNTLYILLQKSNNSKKSKNSSEKTIDFLLQNQCNNFSLKTCGCNSFFYYTNVWTKNEQFD
jgi:hypothetical protein